MLGTKEIKRCIIATDERMEKKMEYIQKTMEIMHKSTDEKIENMQKAVEVFQQILRKKVILYIRCI